MRKILVLSMILVGLAACNKVGGPVQSLVADATNNWVEYTLPTGCVAKQITKGVNNLAVLCQDGRVFS